MRLYDKILVNIEMLPITDKEKILLQNAEFQTNDMGRGRQDYRITDQGFLELVYWEWEGIAQERRKKILGYERLEDVHKDIFFHAHILNRIKIPIKPVNLRHVLVMGIWIV